MTMPSVGRVQVSPNPAPGGGEAGVEVGRGVGGGDVGAGEGHPPERVNACPVGRDAEGGAAAAGPRRSGLQAVRSSAARRTASGMRVPCTYGRVSFLRIWMVFSTSAWTIPSASTSDIV